MPHTVQEWLCWLWGLQRLWTGRFERADVDGLLDRSEARKFAMWYCRSYDATVLDNFGPSLGMHVDFCPVCKQNIGRDKVHIHVWYMENVHQRYLQRRSSSVCNHDLYCPNSYSLELSLGCIDVNGFPERYVQAVELTIGGKVFRCTGIEDPMVGSLFSFALLSALMLALWITSEDV